MTGPRPDPDSERAGESEYGNDSGFAGAATEQEPADPTLREGPDEPMAGSASPGEPPD